MKPGQNPSDRRRVSAIALISLASLGLLLFFLAALAPAYLGQSAGSLPSTVLLGLGGLMVGLSVIAGLLMALPGLKRPRS